MMTLKQEQIIAIQDIANHAHPAPVAPTGFNPLTDKFRRATKAAQYASGSRKFGIDTNYKQKAKLAKRIGEAYDEAADRKLQAKRLEEQRIYKRERAAKLSADIQARFNTPAEHIIRSQAIREQQNAAKAAEKAAKLAARQSKSPANTLIMSVNRVLVAS